MGRNADRSEDMPAEPVDIRHPDRRGHAKAAIDRVVVPHGDVVVGRDGWNGRGVGTGKWRADRERGNRASGPTIRAAADDQRVAPELEASVVVVASPSIVPVV